MVTQIISGSLHGVDAYRAKSMTLVRRLGRALDLPVRSFDCSGDCHGTLTDWANQRLIELVTMYASVPVARERDADLAIWAVIDGASVELFVERGQL